ncbi:hypothetical protein ACYEXS_05475 [Paenibacillus sp. MAH-36]|uniref:Secreted protein n=1 Tax=Paenibacillus violae TaxID=3077234 RepID=A0ABU3REI5_9BACL|nr:hypothetical protein [Paenibacillus sp. PFR10]MDU0202705.1 hypothetical protein [Paenibacillus sp. PFR10]
MTNTLTFSMLVCFLPNGSLASTGSFSRLLNWELLQAAISPKKHLPHLLGELRSFILAISTKKRAMEAG